jgi:hypothetical protein
MSDHSTDPTIHTPETRAGDKDREAMADRLRDYNAEGRLDVTEFQERLDRCYEAKTMGELASLATDMPDEQRHHSVNDHYLARRRHMVPLVPILLTIAILGAVSGGHHHAWGAVWLVIPVLFLVRALAHRGSWHGYGRA